MRYNVTDLVQQSEIDRRATAMIALAVACDSRLSDVSDLRGEFGRRGFKHYDHLLTKADVSPLTIGTDPALLGRGPLEHAFLAAVDHASIIDQLVGAVRMPLAAAGAGRILLGTVEAGVVEEGVQKPLHAGIDFDLTPAPQKAQATIVVSADLLRLVDTAVQDGVRQHLVSAAAAATDALLIAAFTAGSSTGSTDPGALLAAISNGQPVRPVIVAGWDVLLEYPAGTVRDLQALGVALVPCGAAAGVAIAVDTTGLLLADAGVLVQTARDASLAMTDDGSGVASFSLFQRNCVALRAERWLSIAMRPDAIAHASLGSP